MTKISTSEGKLITLSFEGECLEALQQFAYPNNSGDERQVKVDIKRMYGLTIGEWSYVKPSKCSAKTSAGIELNPEEFFFNTTKKLDKKFQDFLLFNFHQGGMFYTGRQFLTFHLNSLGFNPNPSNGHKHHIICDFADSEKLVITENFSVNVLDFVPDSVLYKIIAKEGKLFPIDLKQTDKDKIIYFQKYLMKCLSDTVFSNDQYPKLQIEKKSETEKAQLFFNSDKNTNLMEFTVKHTVKLDSTSPNGIKVKKLSKEDVSFKVDLQLYDLNVKISKNDFSEFLSPDLSCVPYKFVSQGLPYSSSSFFAKPTFESKISELLNSYRNFILALLNILFKLIFPPIPLPGKSSFLTQSTESSESQNSFAYRLRA